MPANKSGTNTGFLICVKTIENQELCAARNTTSRARPLPDGCGPTLTFVGSLTPSPGHKANPSTP